MSFLIEIIKNFCEIFQVYFLNFKAEEDLRNAQTEFDRQCELTKLLMDEINVSYVIFVYFFYLTRVLKAL